MSKERGSVEHWEWGFRQSRQGNKHDSVPVIRATPSPDELATAIETLAHSIRTGGKTAEAATMKLGEALKTAKAVYNVRRKKAKILREPAIADGPAWDILLDLFINSGHQKPVSVTSAAIGASCPPTTALRWLQVLQDQKLVMRVDDPEDKRRRFVTLTSRGNQAVVDVLALYQAL